MFIANKFQDQLIEEKNVKNIFFSNKDFFYIDRTFYRPVPYLMHKKNLTKNPLNSYLFTVKYFHGDSARPKNLEGGVWELFRSKKVIARNISFLQPFHRYIFFRIYILYFRIDILYFRIDVMRIEHNDWMSETIFLYSGRNYKKKFYGYINFKTFQ